MLRLLLHPYWGTSSVLSQQIAVRTKCYDACQVLRTAPGGFLLTPSPAGTVLLKLIS